MGTAVAITVVELAGRTKHPQVRRSAVAPVVGVIDLADRGRKRTAVNPARGITGEDGSSLGPIGQTDRATQVKDLAVCIHHQTHQ
ncbi:hypothetical protein Pph01_52100 [Planotetraspora phitsanulokensis]|uniref:Uncharacterized protein n=1 Tax=Planotetraspora phitsanulokensis TaxID=575192 RepID=A0A8J3XFY4_9ACTN|nr:hypothetical protein Pph01_52100 [Planotetraspora phitsanulokensis]